jgi:hypothetical protein
MEDVEVTSQPIIEENFVGFRYVVKNNTAHDICLLEFRMYSDVFQLDSLSGTWFNLGIPIYNSFYKPAYPTHEKDNQDEFNIYDLREEFRQYPEYFSFYENLRGQLQNQEDEDRAEWELNSLYCVFGFPIFIKKNDVYIDTIDLTYFYSMNPKSPLKFITRYPFLLEGYDSIPSVKVFRNQDWIKEKGISFPDQLDGYKLIWGEIDIYEEVIFDPCVKPH